MLDTPTLECKRVSSCRSALAQNPQQIFKFASIGHGAPQRCSAAKLRKTVFRKSAFCGKPLRFADATNRRSQEDHTQKLSVGSTCLTEDQFKAMVAGVAAAGAPSAGSGAPDSDSALGGLRNTEPSIITINGDNPATIKIDDTYADLGATSLARQQEQDHTHCGNHAEDA